MSAPLRAGKLAVALVGILSLLAAGCAKGGSDDGSDGGDSAVDLSALGEPNEATGTPIALGLVYDGQTDGRDNSGLAEIGQATVDYLNDYAGGINGHRVELTLCDAKGSPSGATACGAQLGAAGVAAVMTPSAGADHSILEALKGSGIPMIEIQSADLSVMGSSDAFVLSNPVATVSGDLAVAKEHGVKSAAMVVVDLPATAQVGSTADPYYQGAGIELNFITISMQTADMTPQLQQAISSGAEMFTVFGNDTFLATALKGLRSLGFDGPIVTSLPMISQRANDSVPGGFEGVVDLVNITTTPDDPDRKLLDAIVAKYGVGDSSLDVRDTAFVTTMVLARALADVDGTDAEAVHKALSHMKKPLPLPLGGGLTFQCGADVVPMLGGICVRDILQTTLDADGQPGEYSIVPLG